MTPPDNAMSDARTSLLRLLRSERVRRLMKPDQTRIRIAFVAMTFRGLLALGVPYFFGSTIGIIVRDDTADGDVIRNVVLLLTFALLTAFSQFWMRWLYIGASRNFEERLRNEVFEHLERLSFSWFNHARTGDILSRLTADVEAVRMGGRPGRDASLPDGKRWPSAS